MSIDSYGIHVGFLYFRFYGLLVMLGVVVGSFFARWLLSKMDPKEDPDIVWDALLWAVVFGVIGARIYHIFTPSISAGRTTLDYLTSPFDAIAIWEGGLGVPGAIVGGVFGLYLFARRRKKNLLLLLDAAAPGMALGHAVGRWGNYVNQELYGPPTDVPWGIFIRPENRLAGFEAFERFHPLFLYEALWNLGVALALYWIWRRFSKPEKKRQRGSSRDQVALDTGSRLASLRLHTGDIFFAYLVAYPFGRFLLEFIRLDYVPAFGLNLNQILMLIVAVASAVVIYLRQTGRLVIAA